MTRDQAIWRIMDAFEALAGQSNDDWLTQDKIQDECIAALLAMGATREEVLAIAKRALHSESSPTV